MLIPFTRLSQATKKSVLTVVVACHNKDGVPALVKVMLIYPNQQSLDNSRDAMSHYQSARFVTTVAGYKPFMPIHQAVAFDSDDAGDKWRLLVQCCTKTIIRIIREQPTERNMPEKNTASKPSRL